MPHLRFFPLALTALLSTTAFADNVKLFVVEKPEEPQNLIQVVIGVNNCHLGNLDYHWWMNGKTYKPMNEHLKVGARARISVVNGNADHKAACPKGQMPEGTSCQTKFVSSSDLGIVQHGLADPNMVVKAIKTKSGACLVAAFLDLGSQVVQVDRIKVKGAKVSQSIGLTAASATVRVDSVTVSAGNGFQTPPWTCSKNCLTTATVSYF